jgi:hypothetical protein
MQQLSLVLTAATALTWLVDLAAVPSKRTVSLLAEGCPCPPEAAKLRQMATEEGYKEKVSVTQLLYVDMTFLTDIIHDTAGHRRGLQGESER